MNWYILPLTLLALYAVFTYFRGMKKNKWVSGFIASETEAILKPKNTEYVNIGGAIGYNFTYTLQEPFTTAKGTFALIPRQSAFYMPVVLILGGKDRYYLTIFTSKKLIGEGHIIEARYFNKISKTITGIEKLKQDRIQKGKRTFVLLWDVPKLEEKLHRVLDEAEEYQLLKHFCVYRDNSNFYIFMEPKRHGIEALLGSVYKNVSLFWEK
ncbi:hypothetical protein [Gracilinema caldarium]|uniref:Uncharacterized protein n=1 Tax=Gracilinema caldarium (strain ATCC 51460 / DSM 7334 / H1) TaxID=744872 RepID=F8F1U9_GRAC1|nr:hypothetical protein [Gracilinema caldarium]AEJ19796.1 hypothetical protein Spica_1653 [Gracilinema caldarium DSM 7334]